MDQSAKLIIVIEGPRTEREKLAVYGLIKAALAPRISQAEIDDLTARLNESTDSLAAALPVPNATGDASA
jgi:hypothetical protein